MKQKVRESNFELLRILSMVMVIGLHLNGTANALALMKQGDANYYLVQFYESLCICSVDCFVLISGYFTIQKHETSIKKLLGLLIDVAFWGLLGYAIAFVSRGERVGIKDIIIAVVPYIKGSRWFVRDYIILMLLSPFLNVCLTKLSRKNYRVLLVVEMLFLSIWPSFFPNPPIDYFGYSFTHFILLYTIAGYLKLHLIHEPKKSLCGLGFAISVLLVFASAILGIGYAFAYNYVFVMTAAVSLFLLFRGIRLQSKAINWLAAGAFDVFVIHTTGFFAQLIYVRLFHVDTVIYAEPWKFLLTALLCPPIFYLVSIFLSKGKHLLYHFTVDKLLAALPIKNYYVE